MSDILSKYGLAGVVIVALAWFVMYLMKDHKKERKAMAELMEKMFNRQDEREKETNTIIKDNSNILTGLKTLFEIHLRDKK